MDKINKIIDVCTKAYLVHGDKILTSPKLLKFSNDIFIPSCRQLRRWKMFSRVREQLGGMGGEVDDMLGVYTPSFITGLFDSGVFSENKKSLLKITESIHRELLLDFKESKLPIKISDVLSHGQVSFSRCTFLKIRVANEKCKWNEYFGGLFSGANLVTLNDEQWLKITPKNDCAMERVVFALDKYMIVYKLENNKIFVSPFYGALFFGYMPIHSATRAIHVQKPAEASKLALVYWNVLRLTGKPVAPPRVNILPYAKSYATYWNRGVVGKNNIRELGIGMGVIGLRRELRELMKEWIMRQEMG